MLRIASKNQTRQRVHDRIRKKVMGTPERPRLNVYRSLNHIYVQLIDDLQGRHAGRRLRRRMTARARALPAATWRRRKWWARRLPNWPRRRASPKSYSIAAATFITAGSRPWPMRRARRDCSSKRQLLNLIFNSESESSFKLGPDLMTRELRDFRMPRVTKKLDAGSFQLKDQVVSINRVTKVVKGGKNMSFAALVVVGDPSAAVVGYGSGKARKFRRRSAKGSNRRRRT